MKIIRIIYVIPLILLVILFSCHKETAVSGAGASINSNEFNRTNSLLANSCDQFVYSDTIFFPAELPNDYIVKPLYPLTGKFGAFPDGLKINQKNGNIDITESETGLKYLIWFVPTGTTDTCKKFITVSGINYVDSIYTLNNSTGIASPVYNAAPLQPTDCNGGCEFDDGADDDDGDGTADEPLPGQEVIPQGIAMDKATGTINLRQSLLNGALGANPVNGTYKDFVLNYRIGDRSTKALNKISFRLIYYKTQAQIPDRLKKALAARKQFILLNEGNNNPAGFTGNLNSPSVNKNGAGEAKCRPPYIIIVQK